MNKKNSDYFKLGLLFVSFLFLVFCPCPAPNLVNVERGLIFSSQHLGQVPYTIYLPPDYNVDVSKRFPVLYLLHGGGLDAKHDAHACKLALSPAMERLSQAGVVGPMIIVMPDGDTAWWIDRKDGTKPYESYLIDELIPFIDSTYRTMPDRKHRAIGGLSMGGYGSLSLSLRHIDLFKAAAVTSPIFLVDRDGSEIGVRLAFRGAFGKPFDPAYFRKRDPLALIESMTGDQLEKLDIYFDRGDGDKQAVKVCDALHEALDLHGKEHVYNKFTGKHNRKYFKEHLDDALKFIWEAIKP